MMQSNLIARVEVLSSVHIGSGVSLRRGIDWVAPGDEYVYVADPDQLLTTVFDRAEATGEDLREVANTLSSSTLEDLQTMGWITKSDYGVEHPLFKYRLRGRPATVEIREQIKDVYGRPYLPGSSLKGALRTILADALALEHKPDLTRLGTSRSWAAQPLERELFGADPNHDLLRALQVADSQPVGAESLRLQRVHIYPTSSTTYRGRSRGLDLDYETICAGTIFELPIHMTTELLTDRDLPFDLRRHQELRRWVGDASWLETLARHGKDRARELLTQEYHFFEKRTDVPTVHKFYIDLINNFPALGANEFYTVLGWGGGWHTKTISGYLGQRPDERERIIQRYRLSPTGRRRPGDPFPKSRHLIRLRDQAGPPLGWVKVSLE